MARVLIALIVAALAVSCRGQAPVSAAGVNLSWSAPPSSPDPVAGFYLYRSAVMAYSFAQLNPSPLTQASFTDATAQPGQAYDYFAEAVDAAGLVSAPTNILTVIAPPALAALPPTPAVPIVTVTP